MSERDEFETIVAEHKECGALQAGHTCGCLGSCLGNKLAHLRRKYDADYPGVERWWSDQLHGALLKRPGDSGRPGAALSAENYWTGAQ